MSSVADIEKAVLRLGRDDFVAFQTWFQTLVDTRLRPERHGVAAQRLVPLADSERESLIAHAKECSRRLLNDPVDGGLVADVVEMQAENADTLEP